MSGEKLGGGNNNGNTSAWDNLSQDTRDQIALDALKADLKQRADEEKNKEMADKIAAETGAGDTTSNNTETAPADGGINWEDAMKGVDFLDGTKPMTEEEKAQAEKREAFQANMDRLKEKNIEFEDAYADAMAVRNSLWDRMSEGEKLTQEEETALYEAEATLRQARLRMEDVQQNGLSSEYLDGKKEERDQQMYGAAVAASEVLDGVYEQNQASESGIENDTAEAPVEQAAEADGEAIVDTGIKLSPEQERVREIFRENLEKNPNNIPRVEANKQAKSQLKTWQRIVVGATAAFMLLKAGMGIYDHLKTQNVDPIPVTEEQDDTAEQDVDDSEKDVMRIDANYYVENADGEKEQITENIAQRDSIEFGNHQIFDTEVDKDGRFDDASKKEGEHSFGTHLAPSQLSGDNLGGCREYVGNRAERLAQQDVSLAEMMGQLGMLNELGISKISPNTINEAIDVISRMPGDARQRILNDVLDGYAEMIEGTTVSSTTFKANHSYITKYALKITENGEERMSTVVQMDASKSYDFEVMQYLDDEGNNILDEGEIKLNILKAHGLVSPDAELDSEEAQAAMKKYTVVGERAACGGQMVIVENGDKSGSEGTGSEPTGNEPTGN
ncbi:MAG: hypothetical protein Q4E47_03880, partial [Candidatus Saccharibacteria bacterium]|nr:hypothetical protein [Candidatus Saccharibacteria bacterium]